MNPIAFMTTPKKTNTTKKSPVAKASTTTSASNTAVAELIKTSVASTKSASGKTQIVATIDIGFGNDLYIRGSAAGLNWNVGQKMTWSNGTWVWNSSSTQNFEFKVLINDQVWSQGENYSAKAGQKTSFTPQF